MVFIVQCLPWNWAYLLLSEFQFDCVGTQVVMSRSQMAFLYHMSANNYLFTVSGCHCYLCPASAFPLTTLSLCTERFAGKGETMSLSGMTLSQYSNGKYTSIWLFAGRHVHGPFLSVQLKPLLWLTTLSPAIPVSPHCQLLTCSVSVETGLDLSHNNSESLYLHLPKHTLSNKSL